METQKGGDGDGLGVGALTARKAKLRHRDRRAPSWDTQSIRVAPAAAGTALSVVLLMVPVFGPHAHLFRPPLAKVRK